jgi:hypothetical protein
MYENIFAWAGLGLIFFLCLPLAGVQRFFLTLYGLALRLGMLALIGAAAYLWCYPNQLPNEIADAVGKTPLLKSMLPDPGRAIFAICALALVAVVVLPLIAVIDRCRRAAYRREEIVIAESVAVQATPIRHDELPEPPPEYRVPPRFGRRAAADSMAKAGATG